MKKFILLAAIIFLTACSNQNLPNNPPSITGYAIVSNTSAFSTTSNFNITYNPRMNSTEINKSMSIQHIGEDYVYKHMYYYDGTNASWEMIDFDEPTVNSSNWIEGDASYILNLDRSILNLTAGNRTVYLASYSCSWVSNAWDCNNNRWVITQFTIIADAVNISECFGQSISNYSVQSNVSFYNYFINSSFIDHCISNTTLTEYICSGNSMSEINYTCPYGCYQGACAENMTQNATIVNSSSLPHEMRVLSLSYIPLDSYGNVDTAITGWVGTDNLTLLQNKIHDLNFYIADALSNGSIYRGYSNSSVKYLNYSIYDYKEFHKETPKYTSSPTPPNHQYILKNEGFDICNYVDNLGVKEVWLWMYHTQQIYPVESYQIGPSASGIIGFGNGYMDLPVCQKSYTVYDYNYGRSLGEALEDHTHHLERIFMYVDYGMYWDLFSAGSSEFISTNKASYYDNASAIYRCGWTHCPPNVIISRCGSLNCTCDGYNWYSNRTILSDCEDWQPDSHGALMSTSCLTWKDAYISPYRIDAPGVLCPDDGGVAFKVWWMQSLPGYNNTISYNGMNLRNFWDFVADFDSANAQGRCIAC